MKLIISLSIVALQLATQAYAQTGRPINGVVRDFYGTGISMATIKMLTGTDSVVVIADAAGRFSFSSVKADRFSLLVSSLGYRTVKQPYELTPGYTAIDLDPIFLESDTIALTDVTITSSIAVEIKEDTVQYNASAYKVQPGSAIEDALKKMPGLEVGKDGGISAQGKQVSKVQLNGKDYMAGDVKSLTRTLPADLVQNVQVIDDYGDQARFTGVKTGESQKVLNINIQREKNYGYALRGSIGGGKDALTGSGQQDNAWRYGSALHLFHFRGKRQVTLSGGLNNTNTGMFDFNDDKKGPEPFSDKQEGITTAHASGFNYRDDWGEKVTVYGSYRLARNSVYTRSATIRDNLSGLLPSIQNSSSTKTDQDLSHCVDLNLEYHPDTLNYVKISPALSFNRIRSSEITAGRLQAQSADQTIIADYTGNRYTKTSAAHFDLNVLYNHRFHKRGRNFNVQLTGSTIAEDRFDNPVYNYLAGRAGAPANQVIHADIRTDSAEASFSYLEPIAKKSYLEINYNFHHSRTAAGRLTDTVSAEGEVIRDPGSTNDYAFTFMTNRFGVNYKLAEKKYNITLGLGVQPASLSGSSSVVSSTRKTTFHFSPVLRYVYNFSDLQALAFNFQGTSRSPDYNQLLPVTDFSNAGYPVQGNPGLLPEYNNTFQVRYNKFGDGTGSSFFSTLEFTRSDRRIVANTVNYPEHYKADPRLAGTVLTRYANASGFYNATAYYVLMGAWARRKYTWMLNGNLSYSNNISYLTDVPDSLGLDPFTQKNISKNLVLNQGARFRVDIANIIDAEANATYRIGHSGNSVANANLNNNFHTLTLGVDGKLYFFKRWTLGYTYSKVIYRGYQDAADLDLLDTYLEYRFPEKNQAALRFAAYDLFNENTGFTSTQNAFAITQRNVNRLGRYFLLSFTLRLQKFAGTPSGGTPDAGSNGG